MWFYDFYHNQVQDLRKLITENSHLPIDNLRLVLRGNVLHDNKNGQDEFIQLNNGGIEFFSFHYLSDFLF